MPYPSKTNSKAILAVAAAQLATGGIRDLSLRNVAASLGLASNAIYRYFPDRAALEVALANEASDQLEMDLRKAANSRSPQKAIRQMASAYAAFAKNHRHLYELLMSHRAPEHDATPRHSLWLFTLEQVQQVTGERRAPEAAVALWAFLHGAAALEANQVFGERKPASGLRFGLDAWLLAASSTEDAASNQALSGVGSPKPSL
jgi:AcrR family transcriptional regulator